MITKDSSWSMATYVDGEAPETDSDEEQDLFNLSYLKV